MTPEEVGRFLTEVRLAHLATVDPQGRPRARPVWFLWRDGAFVLTTRLRRRSGRDIRAGSAVALSIGSEQRPYRGVVAFGAPQVVEKDERLMLALSTRYGEAEGRAWTAEAMQEDDRVLLRLRPDRIVSWDYGREG